MSQIRDVVLVRCIFNSGNPRGSGFWNGKGMEMGRSVYEQPGTKVDGILSQQGGFQVRRRETKGAKGNEKREKQKARGCTIITLFVKFMYIVNACNCLNVANLYMCA